VQKTDTNLFKSNSTFLQPTIYITLNYKTSFIWIPLLFRGQSIFEIAYRSLCFYSPQFHDSIHVPKIFRHFLSPLYAIFTYLSPEIVVSDFLLLPGFFFLLSKIDYVRSGVPAGAYIGMENNVQIFSKVWTHDG
jgi:hypothetical protein